MHQLLFTILGAIMLLTPSVAKAATDLEPMSGKSVAKAATDLEPISGKPEQIINLANGLQVLILKDDRFPLVSIRLYVKAGASYEQPAQAGISHVLEHMTFKGTETRPKGKLDQEIELAGGRFNAFTSYDNTCYLTDMPARNWKIGLDVVRDMTFHTTLDPAELEKEKEVIFSEIHKYKDEPGSMRAEAVMASSLKGTVYQRPIIGFEETVRAISVENLRDYIKKYYQPQNMLLVVAGNIDPTEVLAEVEKQFSVYQNTSPLAEKINLEAIDLPLNKATVTLMPGPWNKVYLSAALPVPGLNDLESCTLDVLAYLMGGDETSQFYRKYKYDLQMVDSIGVYNSSLARVGLFQVAAVLDADKLEAFWKELTLDLAQLDVKRFNAKAINRAKLNLMDSIFRAKETLSGLAEHVGSNQLFLGGEQGQRNMLEMYQAINQDMLVKAAEKWLRPERLNTVILTPKVAVPENLETTLQQNWGTKVKPVKEMTKPGQDKEIIELGNGNTLILLPDAAQPYLAFNLTFSGGEALLTEQTQGLGNLAAQALFQGTKKRSANQIEDFLSDRAAYLSGSTSLSSFRISGSWPTMYASDMLGLINEVLTTAKFAPEEVERAKKDQLAALKISAERPMSLAMQNMPKLLYPNTVFGYSGLGTEASVTKFTAKDAKKFWKKQQEYPWVLAVAGTFNRQEIIDFAKNLPAPKQAKIKLTAPVWGTEKSLTLKLPERNQAHLFLLFKSIPLTDANSPKLDLLLSILNGMSGSLFKTLRDDAALAYTVAAFDRQSLYSGYLGLYIGTTPDKLEQAKAGFAQVLKDIQTNLLPAEEVLRGKNKLEGEYYLGIQSLRSRASEAASLTLSGLPLDFMSKQIASSQEVTAEILLQMANDYLILDEAYTLEILP